MTALKIQETTSTKIFRAMKDGGDITVERVENDMICGECGCYLDNLDVDVYYCETCGALRCV